MSAPQVELSFPGGPVKKSTFSGGLFIDNKFIAGSGTLEVVNPSTGKRIADVAEAQAADVDKAVAAAQKAFDTVWGLKVPGSERGRLLFKLADLIDANADELAAIESLDNGKPLSFARGFDVPQAAACLRYYGGWADKNAGEMREVHDKKIVLVRNEPVGVCGQIIPWNFPILMLAWKLGPALAAGCTIVLKSAEQTPLSALKVAELVAQVYPPGVVNIITGFGKTAGAAIAEHPGIQKVAFTGSTIVGRTILKAAANSNLKKVTLELGGKSPNIIMNDADLKQAVSWAAFGLFFNQGQCCCAGSRVYVQDGIYDKFMEALHTHVKNMKQGSPFDQNTFLGPQVSQLQYDRVMAFIDEGQKSGAKMEIGGKRSGDAGYFIEPTIFTGVAPDAKIMREEIFGPVVVVARFSDEADLIKQANETTYGLAAAVFSRDISTCFRIAHALKAGTCWVNCYNELHPQVEFGGYRESGIGRELGPSGLSNYVHTKSIHINLGLDNAPL